jgi:hypothetical protein
MHAGPLVQHPIHRRGADPGLGRDLLDGEALGHLSR